MAGQKEGVRRSLWPQWLSRHGVDPVHPVQPHGIVAESRASLYNEESICSILGIRDVPLIKPQDLPSYFQRLQQENSVRALTIAFWLLHQRARAQQIAQLLGRDNLAQLIEWGFVREVEEGVVEAVVDLYPCLGDFVFTDPLVARKYANDHVYQLGTDSYVLARVTPRKGGKRALDLCTGSGIHAIQSAHVYRHSIGVDINPRALQLSRINAEINGLAENCRFVEGDLYAPVKGQKFELITVNPPFVPTPDADMHIHRTGGESGEVISQRLVEGLPAHLAAGGLFSMVLDFPVMRSSTYLQRLASWLAGEELPAGASVPGWGIAVLNFGHWTVENYIRDHVDPSDPGYYEMYERYLASYERQGIYEVGFGNVFIQRLPKGHPGYAVEHLMVNPYVKITDIVEAWLTALAAYPLTWEPDWASFCPRRSPWLGEIWSNLDGSKGIIEFTHSNWSGPLQVAGSVVELLRWMDGTTSAESLAQRWARQQDLPEEQARVQVQAALGHLGRLMLIA